MLTDPGRIRSLGGVDPDKLTLAWEYSANAEAEPSTTEQKHLNPFDDRAISRAMSSAVVVVRHGHVVGEWYQNADKSTRWDIHSCAKSFTGTAYGILFRDSVEGNLPHKRHIDLDSAAYKYIPEGHPLTDPRKEKIKIRHLLTMTSCIKGEDSGVFGLHPQKGFGPFELALGQCPTEDGASVSELWGDPGTKWDYSDPAFAHLSLILHNLAEMELDDYLKGRVFKPIGLEDIHWEHGGGDDGNIGPHTIPNGWIHTTARDFARFGYLALHHGAWRGRQLVPKDWMETATRTSQPLNKNYGYTWWVNTQGTLWQGVPKDAFAAMGFKSNKCYVIPSLDLVVVRIGDGPWPWDDSVFLRKAAAAVL